VGGGEQKDGGGGGQQKGGWGGGVWACGLDLVGWELGHNMLPSSIPYTGIGLHRYTCIGLRKPMHNDKSPTARYTTASNAPHAPSVPQSVGLNRGQTEERSLRYMDEPCPLLVPHCPHYLLASAHCAPAPSLLSPAPFLRLSTRFDFFNGSTRVHPPLRCLRAPYSPPLHLSSFAAATAASHDSITSRPLLAGTPGACGWQFGIENR
jgi:hypothetical protein